jgi:hypothetical protein
MPSALSLFYDSKWIQKHYAKMPTKLYSECAKLTGWNEASVADKLWSAYVRSPEYLNKYSRYGRNGVVKSKIPNEVNEYYDWIYAPLIEIKPEIEKNLKKILIRKNLNDEDGDMNPDRYYWDIRVMHGGGTDRVKKMPLEVIYEIDTLQKTHPTGAAEIAAMTVAEARAAAGWMVRGPVTKAALERAKMELKPIIDNFFIPMQPKTQTGWKKKMFINNNGYIALFIYDFNNFNNNFLNWVTNPFA